MLYTLSTPDWKEAKRQTDIYLVSLQQGVASTRQMTFTKEKNETSPRWAHDGSFFLFLSNREAPESAATRNQLYLMRPDGGEARRITDAKEGVVRFRVQRRRHAGSPIRSGQDAARNSCIACRATASDTRGRGADHQAPDRRRALAVGARQHAHLFRRRRTRIDEDEKARREKKFTVNIRNPETPVVEPVGARRRPREARSASPKAARTPSTTSRSRTTASGSASAGCRRTATSAASRGEPLLRSLSARGGHRHDRAADQQRRGRRERPELLARQPRVAFSAPDDLDELQHDATAASTSARSRDRGKPFRKLGDDFDGDVVDRLLVEGRHDDLLQRGHQGDQPARVARRANNTVRPLTEEKAALSIDQDDDTGVLLINYSDGTTPPTLFTVDTIDQMPARARRGRQLTDPNPQVQRLRARRSRKRSPGSRRTAQVGGVLVKPVGYRAGQRYPLIVAIHGGPASADILGVQRRLRLAGLRRRRLRRAAARTTAAPPTTATSTRPTSSATTSRRATTTS